MANRAIYVGSVTNAMRGKQLLAGHGMTAYIRRATNMSAGDGCGYSLLVTGDGQRAEQILRTAGVRIVRTEDTV